MTNLNETRIFLDNLKITYKEINDRYDDAITIVLEAGEGNVTGYGGFVTDFIFNFDGSFKEVGIWE